MKYSIFIDVDGTLKNDNGEISNRCKNIIRNIVSLGHMVILCTARPRKHVQIISEEIGTSHYVLSSNGAELYDYANDKIIFSNYIPYNCVISVLDQVIKNNMSATLAINDIEYIIGRQYNDNQFKLPNRYNNFIRKNKVKQFMVIDNNSNKLGDVRFFVNEKSNISITNKHDIIEAQGSWFSFVSKNTSKGTAIDKFCKIFSIPKERIICIGNDYNDIPMFKSSGMSIAVKNATDDVLALADYITDSNNDDGVAKILEKLYISLL